MDHKESCQVGRGEYVLVEPLGLNCCLKKRRVSQDYNSIVTLRSHPYNAIPGDNVLMNSQEEDLSLLSLAPAKHVLTALQI